VRIFKWVIGLFCSLVIVVLGGGYLWLRSSLPAYEGRLAGPVKDEVRIVRDSLGLAAILAQNEADGLVALGFAMAQDRLWQMDMTRRAAQGRLSAVIGPKTIEADKLFLALSAVKGLDDYYAALPEEIKAGLTAFSAGVNLFIERGKLPLEFRILSYRPQPWRPQDCLAVNLIFGWYLNLGWDIDLLAGAVADRLGPAAVKDFFPAWPDRAPRIVPSGGFLGQAGPALLAASARVKELLGLNLGFGSNSWVLSGAKTTTGRPILANDPHLGFGQPPVWWEATLLAGDLAVSGAFAPGAPVALVGHTPHLAWGVTNVMIDDSDFYVERLNPNNPDEYEYQGAFEPVRKITRTIEVKGQAPVALTLRLTRHGVIINDLAPPAPLGERVLAMRWVGQDELGAAEAFWGLARARNWAEFNQALSAFACPGQNFVYADVEGNIGWRAAARIPVRRGFDGLLPLEGRTGAQEWAGYLPFEQQPWLFNPAEGFIATANNKTIGPEYPHYISAYWAHPDRIRRIRQLIEAKDRLSMEDVKKIQSDRRSLAAERIVPRIGQALEGQALSDREAKALALLRAWDLNMDPDSAAAAVFETTYNRLFREAAADELGPLLEPWLREYDQAALALDKWLEEDSTVLDDRGTPQREGRQEIIRRAFKAALTDLDKALGSDVQAWRWGRLHRLTFKHPFHGQNGLLDRLVDLGPYPAPGGLFTVNPFVYRIGGDFSVRSGASMRQIIDLGQMDNSLRVITTGQSGHFLSPHYGDQVRLWLAGQHHPVSLDGKIILERGQRVLTLVPARPAG